MKARATKQKASLCTSQLAASMTEVTGGCAKPEDLPAIDVPKVRLRKVLADVRRVALVAHELVRTAREVGSDISEAASILVEQHVMESLYQTVQTQQEGDFDNPRWQGLTKTVGEMLKNQLKLKTINKGRIESRKNPFNGKAVAAEMRRQLGIPPWPEPQPLPVPAEPPLLDSV